MTGPITIATSRAVGASTGSVLRVRAREREVMAVRPSREVARGVGSGAGQRSPPATCGRVRLSVRVRDRRPEPPPCSVRADRCVRAAGRVSPRLRPVRRRQRRDRRRSWPGSAPRSAQPCSPARRRPAGEVRHRPYCEGTSRRRHRTDAAPADRRAGRSLRPDDAVWCGSWHGCGRRLHRCNADFTSSLLKRRPEQKARARPERGTSVRARIPGRSTSQSQ